MKRLTFALAVFAISQVSARKLPEYISVCKVNDPDLNKCLRESIESSKGHLDKGIPKLHIPSLEPLVISELAIDRQLDTAKINAKLSQIKIRGGSNFEIKDLNVDVANKHGKIVMKIPKADVTADYDVKGNVLTVPLNGKGTMEGTFSDIISTITVDVDSVENKGKHYLKIKKLTTKNKVGKGHMKLVDHNKDNQASADSVMTFFNKNNQQTFDILGPIVDDTTSEVLSAIIQQALDVIPVEEIVS